MLVDGFMSGGVSAGPRTLCDWAENLEELSEILWVIVQGDFSENIC